MTTASPDAVLAACTGITGWSGVPCSSLTGLINLAQSGARTIYANAPNEGDALAFAAGRWLGGGRGGVLCQNSGVGNLLNALTSLLAPYDIPALIVAGWRGEPGRHDEPQHRPMGGISDRLFALTDTACRYLRGVDDLECLRTDVAAAFDARRQLAVLVSAGAIGAAPAPSAAVSRDKPAAARYDTGGTTLTRRAAIEVIAAGLADDVAVIATTGLIGRDYCTAADRPAAFYMAGSMGHAAAIGLGVCAQVPDRPVLVLDGDGAILMRLSNMAFAGTQQPRRLAHVVLDNGTHASTGGQPTLSPSVDLAAIAAACGYRYALDTRHPAAAVTAVARAAAGDGPVFVRLRIRPEGETPPRIPLDFPAMAARFRAAITPGGAVA